VQHIAVDLRAAAGSVVSAATTSSRQTEETVSDLARSRSSLDEAQRSVAELELTVGALGSASGEQSAALATVASSVEEIAQHATAVMRAIADAGALDLDARLEAAAERLRTWTADGDAADAELLVLNDLVQLAVSVAYNGVAWRSIESALVALRGEVGQVRQTVTESTVAARSASGAAASMQAVVSSMKDRYDQAMNALDHGLEAIAGIDAAVAEADQRVAEMSAAVERTNHIVTVIGAVAADTSLLSLNAAIESARAGATGRAFSVIAAEIRRLASATESVSRDVAAVIGSVATDSELVRGAIAEVRERASAVTDAALGVRAAVASLRFSLEETLVSAHEVSRGAEEQVRGLERVVENAGRSASALDAVRTSQNDGHRLELYAIGDRAHHIAARRDVAAETAKVRAFVAETAERIEAAVEDAIASRRLTEDDCFDFRYDELTGTRVRELARLFDVSRVPSAGFDPPKYATRWDAVIDDAVIALLDQAFERAAFARPVVIAATDVNGFMYAYPRRFIKAWTGEDAADRPGNRVKRFLEDTHGLRMVRTGLGPAAQTIGTRAPYSAFERAGCALERPSGERPWLLNVFARDVNDVVNDLVMPLYFRGRRHGALRFGYDVGVL
jgi:methyl-accepting chemotaxis protein